MPPRTKRNAPSRRHPRSAQPEAQLPEPDLLSFEDDPTAQSPSVFELEAPPSDPELGRQSTVIRDNRHSENLLAEPIDYAHDVYGQPSGSDIDDGPISSTLR